MLFRSLSSQLLRKALRASQSSLTLALSDHETEILNDCIAQIRSDIFEIEDRTIAFLSNLLTISRCFELMLPLAFCREPLPLLREGAAEGDYTILDLRLEIAKLARVCADGAKQLQSTRFHDIFQAGKLQPVGWRVEHLRIAETERVILPPLTLNPASPCIQQQTQLEVELGMLVLKKAEVSVRVEKLEYDMTFWVRLYNEIRGQQKRWDNEPPICTPDKISTIRRKEVSIDAMSKRDNDKRDEKRHDSGVGMEDTIRE